MSVHREPQHFIQHFLEVRALVVCEPRIGSSEEFGAVNLLLVAAAQLFPVQPIEELRGWFLEVDGLGVLRFGRKGFRNLWRQELRLTQNPSFELVDCEKHSEFTMADLVLQVLDSPVTTLFSRAKVRRVESRSIKIE